MSSLTVISDAAAHNAKRLGGEYSKVIGIADVLYANIQDIGHDAQWKSKWPLDEEIDWAVWHEHERGTKPPFDTEWWK
ncbi:MAG: hypothetical protein K8L91_31535 [Anaerolineae bacterium]|nr:hypothetical protein [Anaerolineae bacterium]